MLSTVKGEPHGFVAGLAMGGREREESRRVFKGRLSGSVG